jgi:hypothetical protein
MPPIHIPCVPKDSANEIVDKLLSNKKEMLKIIRNNLQAAQHRMVQLANKKRSEQSFKVGDLFYLKLQPYKQKLIAHRTF